MPNATYNLKFVFLISVLFVIFVQIACSPQSQGESKRATQKCDIELKDFPAFRGLKIGMLFELNPMQYDNQKYRLKYQVDSSVKNQDQEIENAQELGYIRRKFHVSRLKEQLKDSKIADSIDTKNLETIDIETFDGKLIGFTLDYDKTMQSPSVIETANRFAESLKFLKKFSTSTH